MKPTFLQSVESIYKLALILVLSFPLFCLPIYAQSCGSPCQPTGAPPDPEDAWEYIWDTTCCCWVYDPPGDSPIIIDTTGMGFHLTSAADGVDFDISGSGTLVRVAWTQQGSGNAFLCLPDSDGKCDDGKELFGNFTPQPPSPNPNGFAALAVYDDPENGGNGDGIIDSRDAVFSKLRLWIDENHDGISQPSELHTLPELGVFSLSLKYSVSWYTDQYDNHFRYKGVVNPNPKDGTSKDGRFDYDVFLEITAPYTSTSIPASIDGQPQQDTLSFGYPQRPLSLCIVDTAEAPADGGKFVPSPESCGVMVSASLLQLSWTPILLPWPPVSPERVLPAFKPAPDLTVRS